VNYLSESESKPQPTSSSSYHSNPH